MHPLPHGSYHQSYEGLTVRKESVKACLYFVSCSDHLALACCSQNACFQGILPPEELSELVASKHRPNFVLGMLSELVASTCILSPERFRMDQNITFFHDCHGKCERILKTPIPLSYTRSGPHCLIVILALGSWSSHVAHTPDSLSDAVIGMFLGLCTP